MPATSAVAKKSTAGTKQNAVVSDATPIRISSRVRKEKFSVKELFNQKEILNESEALNKKTPKKKTVEPTKTSSVSKDDAPKMSVGKAADVSKQPVKSQVTKAAPSKKVTENASSPSTSKTSFEGYAAYRIIEVTKLPPKTKQSPTCEEPKLTECIFNENNIDSVIENPSALGLDIVVTKLSESENKEPDEDKGKNNVVTISKVIGGDELTKPVTIVSMKVDDIEEKSQPKEDSVNPESLPKGLSITPKPPDTSTKKPSSPTSSDLFSRLEKDLEDLLNESSVSIKPPEQKEQPAQRNDRRDFRRKRHRENRNGRDSDSDDSIKKINADSEFSRYFVVSSSLVEHNDSLDSESECEETILSHFLTPQSLKKSEPSIYDLAAEVSLSMPAWNLHILPDTCSYLLAHVVRGPHGLPVMNKTIELDQSFNAKVYVNQIYQRQYSGTYESVDAIRELVTSVDHL